CRSPARSCLASPLPTRRNTSAAAMALAAWNVRWSGSPAPMPMIKSRFTWPIVPAIDLAPHFTRAAGGPVDQRVITVVGIGADGWDGLPEVSRAALREADVLLGGARQLGLVP